MGDLEFVQELLRLEIPAREFTARFIHHQLTRPELTLETIQSWQDRTLARVSWGWAKSRETIERHLPEGDDPFEGFKAAIAGYIAEQFRRLRETMSGFYEASLASIRITVPNVNELYQAVGAQIIQQAQESTSAIARIIQEAHSIRIPTLDTYRVAQPWLSQTSGIQEVLRSASGLNTVVAKHFREVAEINRIAEQTIASIPWDNLNLTSRILTDIGMDLRANFVDFSRTYNALAKSLEGSTLFVLSNNPQITRLPAIEYLNSATFIEAAIVEEPRQVAEERVEYQTSLVVEAEEALYLQLRSVDVNLVRLWEGAGSAIESDNPDRVRHAAVSMRELLTHVLHLLAPDDEIRLWNSDSALYDRGKPTRRARLLYICRHINHDPFLKFVETDVDSMIEFISLFQRGTHQLVLPFNEVQLRALKAKMEGVLRFLLEISR
jgi:hypothetical protein